MNLGSILGAVVGVVLIATGVGVLAGSMLLASSLASSGIIGGSIGKFMNSGWGKGLMAAVSLGSAGMAMYGASALDTAGVEAAGAQANATIGAAANNTVAMESGSLATDAAVTNSSFMQSADMTEDVARVGNETQALGDVADASKNAVNAAPAGQGGLMGTNPSGAAANATSTDAATVKSGQGLVGGSPQPTPGGVDPAVSHGFASTSGVDPTGGAPPADTGEADLGDPGAKNVPAPEETTPAPAEKGGVLSQALNVVDKHPGVASVAGNMLGGVGNGIAQKQAMEDQLKAQQWGNMQWQQPGQVANLEAAAAKPITVPQGYLQRAQAARSMVTGNQGVQPLPAASPGAPLAPSPVHV